VVGVSPSHSLSVTVTFSTFYVAFACIASAIRFRPQQSKYTVQPIHLSQIASAFAVLLYQYYVHK